jgi:hypothetical protein
MHDHSLEAWKLLLDTGKASKRRRQVFWWFYRHPDSTDFQCRDGLGYPERNEVSPSITWLIQRGFLEENGYVRAPDTNRRRRLVRVAELPKPSPQLRLI